MVTRTTYNDVFDYTARVVGTINLCHHCIGIRSCYVADTKAVLTEFLQEFRVIPINRRFSTVTHQQTSRSSTAVGIITTSLYFLFTKRRKNVLPCDMIFFPLQVGYVLNVDV